jgi:hypothetical protein
MLKKEHIGKEKRKEKKDIGGTGIRARVERITTANANHYTIPPGMCTGVSRKVYVLTGYVSSLCEYIHWYCRCGGVLHYPTCFDSSVGRALD